ncbi:diaminopimelate epimerase [Eikenella sp. S3360]|uniref:Diaminopimelate epimerase n=1 Tax=Eikenella glucosivorans TaxID=2766967 RepID=A0ABS0N8J0_9NEIS|nr:diaminopimelate epimerase [Eikenella glucosivorans]MBH5328618.1 diaminopimelate epimerase [Eikenella glucosivorans]
MAEIKFTKMHGLGNDFMVVDGISQRFDPAAAPIAAWADRHWGIGFDQLLLVEASPLPEAEFRYRIFNTDGSEVEQCGNGARCFARFVREKGLSRHDHIKVLTAKGLIVLHLTSDGLVTVDMGEPRLAAAEIPFVPAPGEAADALLHEVALGAETARLACVSMGNPHAVLPVADVDKAPVADWGAKLERHPQFPERVNVGFMQVLDAHHIRLRVFERSVGETQACGSGSCAAVVAGIRLGLLARDGEVNVSLPGGDLRIEWAANNHVLMTGPAATVFEGTVSY